MLEFRSSGYIMIGLMFLIAISILYFLLRRTKRKSLNNEIKNLKRIGFINIFVGIILILVSRFWSLAIQKDITNTISIFRPVAILTSEPIKLLAIGLFLAGTIMLIMGSYYCYQYKRTSRLKIA